MSSFTVQIEESPIKFIQIETSIGNNPASIEVQTFDNNIIQIESGLTFTPLEVTNLLNTRISQFLQAGSGIVLASGTDSLTIGLSNPNLQSSNILDFAQAVSGLLTITNVSAGSGISVTKSGTNYTVAVTGEFGLTPEQVDDRVSSLLLAGSNITLNYNDNANTLTISTSGLQPSGNYSIVGHSHVANDITNFESAVSGYSPIKSVAGKYGNVTLNKGDVGLSNVDNTSDLNKPISSATQSALDSKANLSHQHPISDITNLQNILDNKQPSGNYSIVGHGHSINDITGLQVALDNKQLSGNYSIVGHSHIISDIAGLQNVLDNKQPSGVYASGIHYHTSSDITNFNSSVSGLVYNIYAPLNSPALIGVPTAPTAESGTNNTQIANTQFVRTEISNLVNSAPSTLDTLNELAAALGNDPNFATSVASGLGQKANLSGASFTGGISGPSGNFAVLQQSGINVSVSGHTHQYTDIINFASGIDDAVSTLLQAGSYISLNYDNINDTLTIAATGVQPSGNYSVVGHTHTSSNITDFNSSVSGLLPVKDIIGSGYINISSSSGNYIVSATGLQPSGNYAQNIHSHTTSDVFISGIPLSVLDQFIIGRDAGGSLNDAILYDGGIDSFVINDFNSSVSGLLPSVSGSGYVSSNFSNNIYTISVSGLQPSGNYSLVGHTHTSSEITDFNSSVSGLLPVKNILAGTYIDITSSSGIYTINSTGEANLLETVVFNKTGIQIPKLSVVYINGGQGDQPTIALASASGEMTSSKTYGITAENINNMSTGKVIVAGALTGVNTDQFNPTAPNGDINGTTLWLSPTVAGGLTTVKPSAPYHMVSVGTVVRTHQNEGVIEVRIQNGFELEELHNVAISGLANNQFIKYDSSTNLWKNVTATASDISNFNSSVSGLLPVTNILGGTNISVVPSGTVYTVSVSGQLGLTAEEVDDRVGNLLVAGSGINLNYNDNSNILTVSVSGNLTQTVIFGGTP